MIGFWQAMEMGTTGACCRCALIFSSTADASNDGMKGWSQLVQGLQQTLDRNASMMVPVIGLTLLTAVVLFANWKLANWLLN